MLRGWTAAVVFLFAAVATGTAEARLRPPVFTGPDFLARAPRVAASLYPKRAARERLGGTATVECSATLEAKLEACHVIAETPANYGFGEALAAFAPRINIRPATYDGVPCIYPLRIRAEFTPGRRPALENIPRFDLAAPDGPDSCSEHARRMDDARLAWFAAQRASAAQAAPSTFIDPDPTGVATFLTLRMAEGGVEMQRVFKYDCDTGMNGLCITVLAALRPDRIVSSGPCDPATSAGYARANQHCIVIAYDDGMTAEVVHTAEATPGGWSGDVAYVDLRPPASR